METKTKKNYFTSTFILTTWAIIATIATIWLSVVLIELKQNINDLNQQAEVKVITAQKKADSIIREARNKALTIKSESDQIALRNAEELQKTFKNLSKYVKGHNQVGRKYLSSFIISRNNIKYTLKNTSNSSIKPRVEIRFINRYGFITRISKVYWIMDTIQPGETRIIDKSINFNFEEPVYYEVAFE